MEIKLASTNDFVSKKMISVEKEGKSILIANVNGSYYAIGDICTHMGCNLSDGELIGDTVKCPCQASVFNVKTGEVVKGPARDPEPSYTLKIEGDKIITDI